MATHGRLEPPGRTRWRPRLKGIRQCALVAGTGAAVRSCRSWVSIVDFSPFAQPTIRWSHRTCPEQSRRRHPRLDGTRYPELSVPGMLPQGGPN
jgi:hypothetical protein